MSFSGLKTAVVNLAHHAEQTGETLDRAALARDFTQAVSRELVPRAMIALRRTGYRVMAAAGSGADSGPQPPHSGGRFGGTARRAGSR